jgi:hypothetical protein
MEIGYARTSTLEQIAGLDAQLRVIIEGGHDFHPRRSPVFIEGGHPFS